MAEENQSTSYGNIFKTTFLFGFVQLFKAVIGVVKNKIAAVLIGAEGMGVLGIFSTTLLMIQTGAGLGVNQSAVRDISEANGSGDYNKFSKIISITNKVILYTGLLGCATTLVLSYWLSYWTFGDNAHIISYCILSLVVAFNIVNDSKQAILKGMRQLRSLAKASMIGSATGLLLTAPLYYFFGIDGIVPELLIAAIITVLVSDYYVRKIQYDKQTLSVSDLYKESKPMIQMGIALMTVTFLQTIVAFVINAYIRSKGGLEDVGYYSAGTVITNSYFGLIVSALMTDYYPRIAAVNKDNNALQEELNKQSIVSIILCCPMFVLFISLLPVFISILYSSSFLPAVDFVKWSVFGTMITVCSNQVDMILVAKFQTKVFLIICIIFRFIQIVLCVGLYSIYGLEGLGFSYFLLGILHMTIMCITVYKLYGITFNSTFVKIAFGVCFMVVLSSSLSNIETLKIRVFLSGALVLLSIAYTYVVTKRTLNIDVFQYIANRFLKIK